MTLDVLFPISVSNSSLSGSCETSFFRSSIQHLHSSISNGDLNAGGIFASACEMVRVDYYDKGMPEDEAVEKAVEFILRAEDTGHAIKTNERLALTFRKYIQAYPLTMNGFRPAKLENGTHAIEYRFEVDLGIPHPDFPKRTIKYTGLLDGVFQQYHEGKVVKTYVLDEKTTGRISRVKGTKAVDLEKEADNFRLSSQLIGYSWAMNSLGLKVDHALIRKVPLLTTYEPAFELELPITKFMMTRWRNTLQAKVEELVEKYKYYKANEGTPGSTVHDAFYPSYGSSCNAWNRLCPYAQGCMIERGEELLGTIMEQNVSVLQKDGTRVKIKLNEYKLMIERGEV